MNVKLGLSRLSFIWFIGWIKIVGIADVRNILSLFYIGFAQNGLVCMTGVPVCM